MPMKGLVAGAALVLATSACASGPGEPSQPPSLVEAAGQPAPPQARFYNDCIRQAITTGRVDREGATLRYRCTDGPARAFYDGLAAWSAQERSEVVGDGRTWRFTSRMERDPSGLDFCSTSGPEDYRCTVVLRVGKFLGFASGR